MHSLQPQVNVYKRVMNNHQCVDSNCKKKKKRGFGVEESVEIVQLGLNQSEQL